MREQFLQTIESEPEIDNRYKNIVRIDPQGGNGYFSLLFKADDSTTENKIALKFFDPQKSGDAHRVARFKREGEILYRLKNKDYVINSLSKGVNVFQKQLTDKATGLSWSSTWAAVRSMSPCFPMPEAK